MKFQRTRYTLSQSWTIASRLLQAADSFAVFASPIQIRLFQVACKPLSCAPPASICVASILPFHFDIVFAMPNAMSPTPSAVEVKTRELSYDQPFVVVLIPAASMMQFVFGIG